MRTTPKPITLTCQMGVRGGRGGTNTSITLSKGSLISADQSTEAINLPLFVWTNREAPLINRPLSGGQWRVWMMEGGEGGCQGGSVWRTGSGMGCDSFIHRALKQAGRRGREMSMWRGRLRAISIQRPFPLEKPLSLCPSPQGDSSDRTREADEGGGEGGGEGGRKEIGRAHV